MDEMQAPQMAAPAETAWPVPPIAPEPKQYGLFMGPFGLRAGWGIAIFVVVWFLFFGIVGSIAGVALSGQLKAIMAARMSHHHYEMQFLPSLVYGQNGAVMIGLLAFCFLFSKIERRPFSIYGIGAKRWTDIFPGLLWGVVIMSALVGTLCALHVLVFDGQNLHGSAVLWWGFKWLISFVLVGFGEEYTFRGYLQFSFMRGFWGLAKKIAPDHVHTVAFWIAGLTTSIIFTLAHTGNGGENFLGLFQVFMAGITLLYILWRTGSLWWAIGFHATWDWSQSFLFGVADSGAVSVGRLFITHPQGKTWLSGGTAGPEGSVLSTVALLITIGVVSFVKRGTLPGPEQMPEESQPSVVEGLNVA